MFDGEGWEGAPVDLFSREVRNPLGEEEITYTWEFMVEASDPGEVTLTFEDVLTQMPENYSIEASHDGGVQDLLEDPVLVFDYSEEPYAITVSVSNYTGVEEWNAGGIPTEYTIAAAYPNPFNPTLNAVIGLPESADLRVSVYNLLGQEVAVLANGFYAAGYHTMTFDANGMASGLYFIRAIAPGQMNQMRKVMLVR